MKVQEIFTPNDIPTTTYVDRAEHQLEATLRDLYETPNIIVSVSGPSKAGKTVLIKKVVPEDYLITVRGAALSSADDLWDRVLDWMGAPVDRTVATSSTSEVGAGAEGGGKLKVPFVAEGEASASAHASQGWTREESAHHRRNGLEQVIKEIAKSEFVVFIDDFHYIKDGVRDDVGKQIKAAAESGVKIFTASVPHRADDVVRSNPELRGRVAAVDIDPWKDSELRQIARKGFDALNAEIAPEIESAFAKEAFGSPQLMQSICLNLALVLGIRTTRDRHERVEVSAANVSDTLLRTSAFTDFSQMVRELHIGAKTRGMERKEHQFIDGTRGDVYRAILIAMRQDPAKMSIEYDDIVNRVRAVCDGDAPTGSSVNGALTQMHNIADALQPGTSPLSWDDPILDITDPYFLFFIRCSDKIAEIARG